jgi:hypothetical protein
VRALCGVVLLLANAGCRRAGDPVRESVDAMAAAARARDAGRLFARVTPDFQGSDGTGRAEAEALVRRYFAAYEILDVSLSNVAIERSESAALARFTANLSGQPRKLGGLEGLLPSSSSYRFEVRFVPEAGRWKAAWASWSRADGR